MLFLSFHKTFLNTNLSSRIIRSLDLLLEFCEVLIGAILDTKPAVWKAGQPTNNHLIKLCENSRFEQFRKGANSSRNNDYPLWRRAALFIFVLLGKQTTERVTLCFCCWEKCRSAQQLLVTYGWASRLTNWSLRETKRF